MRACGKTALAFPHGLGCAPARTPYIFMISMCVRERQFPSFREPPLQWSRVGKKETKRGRETDRNGEKQGERKREEEKLREREQPSNSSPSPQHDCRAVRLGIKTLASLHPTQAAALQKHSASHSYIHTTANTPHQEKRHSNKHRNWKDRDSNKNRKLTKECSPASFSTTICKWLLGYLCDLTLLCLFQ